jgi:hypothetical protein
MSDTPGVRTPDTKMPPDPDPHEPILAITHNEDWRPSSPIPVVPPPPLLPVVEPSKS